MGNRSKKLLSFVAAMACVTSTAAFAACGGGAYKGDDLGSGFDKSATVSSNGGFAVEKGDYVYFINGYEENTADNTYGNVVKGALVRAPKNDLSDVKTVVPSLFVAKDYDAGIFLYEDYVYYATPTTDHDLDGNVSNSYIDFKRAKLDGSEAPMDGYFLRLSDNSATYRFVEVDGTVYCLYEESGALKSLNTSTQKTTTLVSGSSVTYYYDKEDPTNPNVYYTMSVTADVDSDYSSAASYNQLYCVNAAATVSVDSGNASYTVKLGDKTVKTYDFDEEWLKAQNKEAKDNKEDEPYDLSDYTTYPYVNLGELVLDGIGKNSLSADKRFNEDTTATPETTDGYTYTVTNYANGGVYFTRTEIAKTNSEGENTKLYYLSDTDGLADAWDAVSGNKADKLTVVAANTTNTGSAVFYIDEETKAHWYLYVSGSKIYKESYGKDPIELTSDASSATLWKIDGNYLYYYGTGSGSGNNLSRIDYTGSKEDYNPLLVNQKEAYQPITVAYVDWKSDWYKPEFLGNTLLYANAKAFGDVSYNYIYAAKLGADNAELKAYNEKYEAVQDYIDEYSDNADLQAAMTYYFSTGSREAFDDVDALYDSYQKTEFNTFVGLFADGKEFAGSKLNEFTSLVGKMTEDDAEAIAESWVDSLRSEAEDEDDESEWPTWATVLIIVGGVLIVAAAVTIPLVISLKKKKAAEAEAEATVNAYRRKIDTTDDKSIDVYGDEDESTEEAQEAPAEEAETTEEAPAETEAEVSETVEEEATEAPAEEEKKDE